MQFIHQSSAFRTVQFTIFSVNQSMVDIVVFSEFPQVKKRCFLIIQQQSSADLNATKFLCNHTSMTIHVAHLGEPSNDCGLSSFQSLPNSYCTTLAYIGLIGLYVLVMNVGACDYYRLQLYDGRVTMLVLDKIKNRQKVGKITYFYY